jgi:integration host factor subunit beta
VVKSELISSLVSRHPDLPDAVLQQFVDAFFESIATQLAQGGRVELRGFGSFHTKVLDARHSINPATGERMQAAQKRVPRFRQSIRMHEKLNGPRE